MTRTELIKDMRQSADESVFMNNTQFAKYLGIDRHNTKRYTELCAPVVGKRYFIGDLADAIIMLNNK